MPETGVADLVQALEGRLERLQELLRTDLDFAALEEVVTASLGRVVASVLGRIIGLPCFGRMFIASSRSISDLSPMFKSYRIR